MSTLIIYATALDGDLIRTWINESQEVAWIVKAGQTGSTVQWRAVSSLGVLAEQEYAIWHTESGPLNIPSGSLHTADTLVADPFAGWHQTLENPEVSAPWFGNNLPGPYYFNFKARGREAADSVGRSQFYWVHDRFKAIGKPASPAANRWWQQLRRYVQQTATPLPWPDTTSRLKAWAFPGALAAHKAGGHLDINP